MSVHAVAGTDSAEAAATAAAHDAGSQGVSLPAGRPMPGLPS